MKETLKTAGFVAAAVVLAVVAAVFEPEARTPRILSDQGEAFYPEFKDALAVKTIEVVDYDESTATARPFQVEFRRGQWIIPTHHNYPVDAGGRLAKTAAALMDLRKDMVRSDSVQDHAKYGVVDPLDQNVAGLAGRGKRVTLRDERKDVAAAFIFGKPVEGKPGFRYVCVPGQKRVYEVKTDADPSAEFADWVDAGLLRISRSSIRRVTILSYSIDEMSGRLANMDSVTLMQSDGRWSVEGGGSPNQKAVNAMAATLDNLKIADVRPKPPSLANSLRGGAMELNLETALSLRQKGFYLTPTGRLLANDGEMVVETSSGLVYALRFGEVTATTEANRYLLATVRYDAERAKKYGDGAGNGEALARSLTNRFADWYYVISGADFEKLRLKRKDAVR